MDGNPLNTPLKKSDWAVIIVVGALSALLFCRGLSALITGTYIGTARLSGPFEYHGPAAYMTGTGYIFLAAMLFCAIACQLRLHKKKATIAASAFGIMAVLFLGLGLLMQ
jgi:hypothetical protein